MLNLSANVDKWSSSGTASGMPTELAGDVPDGEQLIKALAYAAETRRFEIERFWQRSLFFWGFIAAAFVAYAALSNPQYDPHLRQLMAAFGLVSSFAWTLQNRGSKYWQEAWEQKVERLETKVLGQRLFGRQEPRKPTGLWGAQRYSASRLISGLSDFTVLTWFALASAAFYVRPFAKVDAVAAVIAIVTIIYCVALVTFGRSQTMDTQ